MGAQYTVEQCIVNITSSGHAYPHGFAYWKALVLKGLFSFYLASPLPCRNKVIEQGERATREDIPARSTIPSSGNFFAQFWQSSPITESLMRAYNLSSRFLKSETPTVENALTLIAVKGFFVDTCPESDTEDKHGCWSIGDVNGVISPIPSRGRVWA